MPKERKQRNTWRGNAGNRNAITEMINRAVTAADVAHLSKLRRKITYPPGHPSRGGKVKPMTHNFEHVPEYTKMMRRAVQKMATHNSVLGNRGLYTKGKGIGRIPKDKVHNAAHPGFQKVAQKIARKEGLPIARAKAILATSSRRRLQGGVLPPGNRTGITGHPIGNPMLPELRQDIAGLETELAALRQVYGGLTERKAKDDNLRKQSMLVTRLERLRNLEIELGRAEYERHYGMRGGVLPPTNRTGIQGHPTENRLIEETQIEINQIEEQITALKREAMEIRSEKALEENKRKQRVLLGRKERLMELETELWRAHYERGGSMVNKLPKESKLVRNGESRKRKATVLDPPDLKLDKELRNAIAMMQANSPLDENNREHVHETVISMHRKKIRLPRVRKLTKTREKGGFIFNTLHNLLVNPE
jgi:hypothetical protein